MVTDVLDPRHDPEPGYWTALREQAGLRADWSWEVLATQAWAARTPQPVTVFREGGRPCGVVSAAWVTGRTRRHRFAGTGRGWFGGLDVRGPGASSQPGWWFAEPGADGGVARLLETYVPAMRAELGPGLRGLLVRQVGETGREAAGGRFRLLRRTEDIAVLDVAGFGSRDDWMNSLARKRKQNLRKIFRTFDADPSVEVRCVPGKEADPVAVAEVLRLNERKHRDVPIVPLPHFTGYLTALLRQPDVVVISYHDTRTGRLLAVATVLDHPARPIARHWGALPPEDGGRAGAYFHFYGEAVRWAIANGRESVVFGKKMQEMKATLGARLVPQYAAAVPLLASRRPT
ncbi:GNAT family N-acetyltransferase [Amycolatopsis sp. OK19-0408]|uniref:GNAT family N-acetyltransferase n=1 Tax=Amycolatopsis iheyensis TaxID=2945988 RepID=A0A9X2N6J5_9PSEU|nr:GNAT family N-acetyltransferase [Amycolatopsis iheyensis]MCR6481355.1 GNAT family N-acetyltransferase [Amycolatopsis iheyensis]